MGFVLLMAGVHMSIAHATMQRYVRVHARISAALRAAPQLA